MKKTHTDSEWTALFERFPQRPLTLARYAPLAALLPQEQHVANFRQMNRYLAHFDEHGQPVLITVTPEVRR